MKIVKTVILAIVLTVLFITTLPFMLAGVMYEQIFYPVLMKIARGLDQL